MCGRFVSASPPDEIAAYFDAAAPETLLPANYNVAPTTDVYAVLVDGGVRKLVPLHWGLIPPWAKERKIASRMINARSETIMEKPSFKNPFKKRRCIIPVDGFYEWQAIPGQKKKQPMFIQRPDGEPFAFGGLWEVWKSKDDPDEIVRSCTIITGPANEKMAEIHDRMPLILPPDRWSDWLDPELQDLDTLGKFLVPAPPQLITFYPVSTDVNLVRNKSPHLIDRVDPEQETATQASHHDSDTEPPPAV